MPGIVGIVPCHPRASPLQALSLYSRVDCKDRPFRFLYTLAMFLVTPVLVLRLLVRCLRSPPHHHRPWLERFGSFYAPGFSGSLSADEHQSELQSLMRTSYDV